jgi:hypothetical protein
MIVPCEEYSTAEATLLALGGVLMELAHLTHF